MKKFWNDNKGWLIPVGLFFVAIFLIWPTVSGWFEPGPGLTRTTLTQGIPIVGGRVNGNRDLMPRGPYVHEHGDARYDVHHAGCVQGETRQVAVRLPNGGLRVVDQTCE